MTIRPASDRSLLISFGARISDEAHRQVSLLCRRMAGVRGILNLHPAFASVLIDFDPRLRSHGEIQALVYARLADAAVVDAAAADGASNAAASSAAVVDATIVDTTVVDAGVGDATTGDAAAGDAAAGAVAGGDAAVGAAAGAAAAGDTAAGAAAAGAAASGAAARGAAAAGDAAVRAAAVRDAAAGAAARGAAAAGAAAGRAVAGGAAAAGAAVAEAAWEAPRLVEIPVCYGGEFGPDLEDVARHCGLDPARVVELHAAAEYLVYFVGFSTCFPYLGGLPASLATPRLAAPRKHVPEGSVAIGGSQAGVYPLASPGGWRLIGRTPLRLFDPQASPPGLLRMDDRVRFRPIPGARL